MYKEVAGNLADACTHLRAGSISFRNAGVNILQLNIDGITSSKLNIIEQLVSKYAFSLILLQETHCTNATKLVLPKYELAGFISSRKHGLGMFVHKGMKWAHERESPNHSDIYWLNTKIDATLIINVYNPPSSQMTMAYLPVFPPPSIYMPVNLTASIQAEAIKTTAGVETASSNGPISIISASYKT